MGRFHFLLFLIVGFATSLVAQLDYKADNLTYVENIKAVRFHIDGFLHSYPVIGLNKPNQLRLSFDDMSDDIKRYTYKIIHCDRDWQPSSLSELEYIDGYSEDNINDYDFSFRTLAKYVHYDLLFPNEDISLTKSGNYLLIVFEDEEEEKVVITKRFYVVEDLTSISATIMRATEIDKIHSHQEVDLAVNIEQLAPRAPLQELTAAVIQNNRSDNVVVDINPTLFKQSIVEFNHQGKVSFAGGNEFRNLDLRSISAPRTEVLDITNEGDHYSMLLAPDRPRDQSIYLNYSDLNGDFVNFRFDQPIIGLFDEFRGGSYDRLNLDYTGDYILVTFVLQMNQPLLEDNVYVFGSFTDFQKKPSYKMVWNPAVNAYVGQALLKQGFYNYWYVTDKDFLNKIDNNGSEAALSKTEGNFEETENDYICLIYYRPIGGRYDQIVGRRIINSNTN